MDRIFTLLPLLLGTFFAKAQIGNIGIGTNAPSEPVEIYRSGSNPVLSFHSGGVATFKVGNDGNIYKIAAMDNGYGGAGGNFATNDVQVISLNAVGNVGIGAIDQTAKLDVNGSMRVRSMGAGFVKSDGSGNLSSSAITVGELPTHTHTWGQVTSKPAAWLDNPVLTEHITDYNLSKPSGFYEGVSAANAPTGGTWYNMINVRHTNSGNDHGFQIAAGYYNENVWTRTYQGGTGNGDGNFTPWRRLLNTNDIPGGTLPVGTHGQTLYNNSGTWTATSNVYNDGSVVGVGVTTPQAQIHAKGADNVMTTSQNTPGGGIFSGGGAGCPWCGDQWTSYSTVAGAGVGDASGNPGGRAGGLFYGGTGTWVAGGGSGLSAFGGDGSLHGFGGVGVYAKGGAHGANVSGGRQAAGYFDGNLLTSGGLVVGSAFAPGALRGPGYSTVNVGDGSAVFSGSVGLGTATLNNKVQMVSDNGSSAMQFNTSGYIASNQYGTRIFKQDIGGGIPLKMQGQIGTTWYEGVDFSHGQDNTHPSLKTYYATQLAVNGGNVGIGVTNPGSILVVKEGTVDFSPGSQWSQLNVGRHIDAKFNEAHWGGTSLFLGWSSGRTILGNGGAAGDGFGGPTALGAASDVWSKGTLGVGNNLLVSGNTGLGTTAPRTKLSVRGTVAADYYMSDQVDFAGNFIICDNCWNTVTFADNTTAATSLSFQTNTYIEGATHMNGYKMADALQNTSAWYGANDASYASTAVTLQGTGNDNQWHVANCPDNWLVSGVEFQVSDYADGNLKVRCTPLNGNFSTTHNAIIAPGATTSGLYGTPVYYTYLKGFIGSGTNLHMDDGRVSSSCPPGTFIRGIAIYASSRFDGFYAGCTGITEN